MAALVEQTGRRDGDPRKERDWGGLLTGLVLLGVGAVFLLRELGTPPGPLIFSGWWAALVAVLGLAKLVRPRRAHAVGSGVTMFLLGTWMFVAHTGAWGLTWRNSWPLALVAVGAGMVARATAQSWLPDRAGCGRRERRHV